MDGVANTPEFRRMQIIDDMQSARFSQSLFPVPDTDEGNAQAFAGPQIP